MKGRVLGSYEIVERLGEGGMGTVYRAVDTMLEREVAIKAIRPDLAAEPQIVERFRSEAKILAKVRHPSIATIYSFFKDAESGELFLAMELVRGRTLSQVLREEGALPWQRAVAWTRAALEGIAEVHRTGIIHRDLKPDNLMVTEIGGVGGIKVMDFGIARSLGSDHLTRTGLMVGTLRYMSPQQLRGQEVDHRSDLYSMGIVLYEMLTGRAPFSGGSEYESMRAQVEDPPPSPGALVPDLPAWLERAVLTALAKAPDERFQGAAEMAAALTGGAWVTNLPLSPARGNAPTVPKATPLPAAAFATAPPAPPAAAPPVPAASSASPGSSYQAVGPGLAHGWGRWVAAGVALFGLGLGLAWFLRGPSSAEPPAKPAPAPAATPTNPPRLAPPRRQIDRLATPPTSAPSPAGAPAPQPSPATPANVPAVPAVPRRTPLPVSATPSPLPSATPNATPAAVPEATESALPDEASAGSEAPNPAAVMKAPPEVFTRLGQLGNELEVANGKLVDAFEEYRGHQKDKDQTLTPAEEKLKEQIDAMVESTTHFNRRVNASAFRRALRFEGTQRQRMEMIQRGHEVAKAAHLLQLQILQARPPATVFRAWQEVARICREIAMLSRRPKP